MENPAAPGRVAPYEEVWRDLPAGDGGVLIAANRERTVWRARVGAWEVGLGRREDGEFWAWHAEWTAEGDGRVLRRTRERTVVLLPRGDERWVVGAKVQWEGQEWDVIEAA